CIRLGVKPLCLTLEVSQVLIGDGPELFEVVLDVQACIVNGRLPNYAVKVKPALGQPATCRDRLVAFGVHQDVAVRFGFGIETLGNLDRRARKGGPRFPAFVPESEHIGGLAQADHVHSQRLSEVRSDLAEHLVRFYDLDGCAGPIQAKCLTQAVNCVHLHPGHWAGAKVEWNPVGLLVLKSKTHSFSRSHHTQTPLLPLRQARLWSAPAQLTGCRFVAPTFRSAFSRSRTMLT